MAKGLNTASVVDYAEKRYHDFPQLKQIDLNSEQTQIFSFNFLTDLMFLIIL